MNKPAPPAKILFPAAIMAGVIAAAVMLLASDKGAAFAVFLMVFVLTLVLGSLIRAITDWTRSAPQASHGSMHAAVADFMEKLKQVPVEEAETRAHRILKENRGFALTDATDMSRANLAHFAVPPGLQRLLEQYELVEWEDITRFGVAFLGPSDAKPGYIRIGFTGEDDEAELAIRPNEEEIHELDLTSRKKTMTYPSIHHLIAFDAQTFFCPHCGYDLHATPGRCPECGTHVT